MMPANDGEVADAELRAHHRDWLAEAVLLVVLAIGVTLAFAVSPLDLAAARLFYRPDAVDHWPLAKLLPWSALYGAAPWITASLVVGGLATLATSFARHSSELRRRGVFLLLSVVLGPGLIINTVFKDHWDRPRPRDIVEFAGPQQYVPAPLIGREAGTSFPCGHCAVGFLYGAGWWVWRHRRPTWARTSLAVGLVAGVALGMGRMAAGGHFLSDVIWSALLAFGVCHILHYHALRVLIDAPPEWLARAARGRTFRLQRITVLLAALGGVGVLIALFATPHGAQLSATIPLSSLPSPPRVLEVEAQTANVEIVLIDAAAQVSIEGELHGFGLPMSRLETHIDFVREPVPTLRYRIEQRGWFTDLDGLARLVVPASGLERVVVRLAQGNIRVTDTTLSGVVRNDVVHLDLRTGSGHVQVPTPVVSP